MKFSTKERVLTVVVLMLVALAAVGFAQSDKKNNAPQRSSQNATANAPASSASETKPTVVPQGYLIGADDVLAVHVWKEPDLTTTVAVRPDGKITLPVIGDVQATGRTPKEVQDEVQGRLKAYVSSPEVTVIVQDVKSVKFNIVGDGIAKPGTYELTPPMNVLDAIALAGGLRDFAKKTKIYVLRIAPDGTSTRIPFNYKEVTKGEKLSQNIELKPRDTIVVP